MSAESFFGNSDFKRDRWGRALITLPDGTEESYTRATTVAGTLDDLNGLIEWKQAMTAFGLARSKALQANMSLLTWSDDKGKVKDVVRKAFDLGGGSEAADIGTAFHRLVELYHGGQEPAPGVELPEGFEAALGAYKRYLADTGLKVSGSEVTIANDESKAAGTADLVFEVATDTETPFGTIKAGTSIIGDIKTGSVSQLSGLKMGMQLAIYSHGTPYNTDLGKRHDWEFDLNPDIGLILKVDLATGEVVPWWLDLKNAYRFVATANTVRHVRKQGKGLIAPAGAKVAQAAPAPAQKAAETLSAREVGKLITAATTQDELIAIRDKYESVFTDKMSERFDAKYDEFADKAEETAKPVDTAEATPEAPAEDDLLKPPNVATIEPVKTGQEAWTDIPADEATAKVAPYSLDDAKARAAEVKNVGQLRELYKEFSKKKREGVAEAAALTFIAEASANFK